MPPFQNCNAPRTFIREYAVFKNNQKSLLEQVPKVKQNVHVRLTDYTYTCHYLPISKGDSYCWND